MSEELIPKDFKVTLPEHTADLGRWMRQNGWSEAIIEIIVGEYRGACAKIFVALQDSLFKLVLVTIRSKL